MPEYAGERLREVGTDVQAAFEKVAESDEFGPMEYRHLYTALDEANVAVERMAEELDVEQPPIEEVLRERQGPDLSDVLGGPGQRG